jgi:hypothetical protein
MAKETGTTRLPRGTKPVIAAFFSALNEVPQPQRAAVTKAAVASIRGEIRANRDKRTEASAKVKVPAPTVRKAVASKKKAASMKKASSPKNLTSRQTIAQVPPVKVTPKPAIKKATPAKRKAPQEKAAAKGPVPDNRPEHSDSDIEPEGDSVE